MEKKKRGRPAGKPKSGGRKAGTPNKVSSNVKGWINSLIDKNAKRLERDFLVLSPKDRLQLTEKLLQYTTAKMQNISAQIDIGSLSEEQIEQVSSNILKSVNNENSTD